MIKSHTPSGSLHVICGPMFSGKTEELIRRLRRAKIAKQEVVIFKHARDIRTHVEHIASHNGTTILAIPTDKPCQIEAYSLSSTANVIGIDEVQFFGTDIINVVCQLVDAGKQVVVAGLDRDFRGVPFGPMPILLAVADTITKLHAVCVQCGLDAHFSQRLVDNEPAKFNDPIIKVGASEAYQARCRSCFVIDRQPNFI